MASTKVHSQLSILCFFYLFAQTAMCFDLQLPDISAFRSCNINKIYNLGDSTSDVGNRAVEDTLNTCLKLPYGENFYQGPTGRCSDGMLIIDYTALAAGVPLLDPYLKGNSNFTHGVNFAVGGASALSIDALEEKNIQPFGTYSSLEVQLEWMSTYFASQCSTDIKCSPGGLKNALFMVGLIGSNDYNFALSVGQTVEQAKNMVPDVVETIKDAIRRVISLGAARIVVPGSFPMGCFPTCLVTFKSDNESAYDENQCLKDINDVYALHNEHLQQALITLQEENPDPTIVYADYYNAYMWLLSNAPQLGFDATSVYEGCCGNGGLSGSVFPTDVCGNPVPACPEPDRYISWDGIHMTQRAHELLSNWLVAEMLPKLNCASQVVDN